MDITRFKLTALEVGGVGVAIRLQSFPWCNTHAGIVYRDISNRVRVLHFGWHERLYNDPESEARHFAAATPSLDPVEVPYLTAYFRRVASSPQNRRIPYNLRHEPGMAFDGEGRYTPESSDTGLTCSTFVIAVFRSAGRDLVDTATWIIRPMPDRSVDEAAQERLVARLESQPETREQADRIRSEVGGPRVRPQEVAGACLEDTLPASFAHCARNGDYILQTLAGENRPGTC